MRRIGMGTVTTRGGLEMNQVQMGEDAVKKGFRPVSPGD